MKRAEQRKGRKKMRQGILPFVVVLSMTSGAGAQTARPGAAEFGLTAKELVQAVEEVESLIADCMREQGFEYVPADYRTVRRGMGAIMSLPGMSEEEFIAAHGYGISTLYTGKAPQLVDGYSPGKVGLGERNVQIFNNLSPADQIAYNRALLGESLETFALALDSEDFSRCGGCTLTAIKQVFAPEQIKDTYYNPRDALIKKDPRMRAALRKYEEGMRAAGFDAVDPEKVEAHVSERLHAITGGGVTPLEKLSPEQLAALRELQEYERQLAKTVFELEEDILEPVEERIEKEMFARPID
jgi:hypothetical protein